MAKRPTCSVCRRKIGASEARIVRAGKLVCADCEYALEQVAKSMTAPAA